MHAMHAVYTYCYTTHDGQTFIKQNGFCLKYSSKIINNNKKSKTRLKQKQIGVHAQPFEDHRKKRKKLKYHNLKLLHKNDYRCLIIITRERENQKHIFNPCSIHSSQSVTTTTK